MKSAIKTTIVLLLATLFIAGCASTSEPQKDPYNQEDSQRSRADKTQDELSRETK